MGDIFQDRNRRYDGQPHTHQGIRGMTEVKGVTMRDIADCLRTALFESYPHGENAKSVYDLDIGECDPLAIEQNLMCSIEKMMGIYPNLSLSEEITRLKAERDAAIADIYEIANHTRFGKCVVCEYGEEDDMGPHCKGCVMDNFSNFFSNFKWRGLEGRK